MRVDVVLQKRDWQSGLQLGLRICGLHPSETCGYIHAAFCLHEFGRTSEARQTLLAGPAGALGEPGSYYHLGCYEPALRNLEQAKGYRRARFRMNKCLRELAKGAPELQRVMDE